MTETERDVQATVSLKKKFPHGRTEIGHFDPEGSVGVKTKNHGSVGQERSKGQTKDHE